MRRVWNYVTDYSLLLIGGAALALIWANIAPDSYHQFVHSRSGPAGPSAPPETHDGVTQRVMTLHFLFNDVLMAFFFASGRQGGLGSGGARDGSLRPQALTPLIATVGGMAGPVAVYLGLAVLLGVIGDVHRGWAIPPPPTSPFPISSGGSCSAPAIRPSGSCCCWRSPTMPAASPSSPSSIPRARSPRPGCCSRSRRRLPCSFSPTNCRAGSTGDGRIGPIRRGCGRR